MPKVGIMLRNCGLRIVDCGLETIHKYFAIGLFFVILSSTALLAQNPTTNPSVKDDSLFRNPQSAFRNSLSVAPTQNPDHFPYRDATLTIENTTNVPISAVRLRWRDGGPAMQFPLAIPPGGKASRPVFLPALSVSQTYDVDLLPADEFTVKPVGCVSVDIHWPVALLTKDAFLDPITWEACYIPSSPWSNTTKTTAIFIGIVITLALAAVLLFRRSGIRFGIWLSVVACSLAAVFVWWFVWGGSVLRETSLPEGFSGKRIQTRRTGEYRLRNLGPQNAPVYAHRSQIPAETLIVHPERCLYLTLRPNETRIFLERRERKKKRKAEN